MQPVYVTNIAQDEAEIAGFCELAAAEGVRSYLEVGSKYGGSLWRVGQALPAGARIVSVDLPGGTGAWRESEASLKACHEALRGLGHQVTAIWGDSMDPKVVAQVRSLGPFDLVLLDGDHRLDGVTRDWEAYGPMGRMIAFHDIAWHRPATYHKTRIDVPQLWNNLRRRHRHQEFCFDQSGRNNGIGVLWRA